MTLAIHTIGICSAVFAQFEREVTSERIRDKIAASKRKGVPVVNQIRAYW
jgi:DNA invertase Pin-like site-specific DNA recombinase